MYVFNTDDNTDSVYFFIVQLQIAIASVAQVTFGFSTFILVWRKVCKRISCKYRKKNEAAKIYQHLYVQTNKSL